MPDTGVVTGPALARLLAEQMFSRIAGAAPVEGNEVRLLRDGAENYPAWLDAIASARRTVHIENYIIRADAVGQRFAAALAAKAREGVAVRLLYDWMGCLTTPRRFWRGLRRAGVEVRCSNPPRLESPFGWLSRNHRKSVSVDGEVGFVAGLCIGRSWVGNPARGIAPWRDTGVELRGPAVADLERAFAEVWALAGTPLPPPAAPAAIADADAGRLAVRVIASHPHTMVLYRLEQLIASLARERLWLTDAYFVGTTAYVRTLCDAARDGVDVRLLVPGSSDIPLTQALSRAGYRPLLEGGVRVFEWNGPMVHAKTGVADGRWARVGSSNLNLASWLGNWELDVAIEDAGFAAEMEAMYLEDLENATEIVLDETRRVQEAEASTPREPRRTSRGRLAASAVGLGSAVSAAITNHRALGPAESQVMAAGGGVLLGLVALEVMVPRLITVPLALLGLWLGVALLARAWRLRTGTSRADLVQNRSSP